MHELTLKIVTPQGTHDPLACDSIRLTVCEGTKGRGGGSYGIRPGHTRALLALEEGTIKALLAGETVWEAACGPGFVTVEQDVVTVVTEHL